jgi:hypothetical protein
MMDNLKIYKKLMKGAASSPLTFCYFGRIVKDEGLYDLDGTIITNNFNQLPIYRFDYEHLILYEISLDESRPIRSLFTTKVRLDFLEEDIGDEDVVSYESIDKILETIKQIGKELLYG